jgi:putative oxidoreductase
MSSSIVLFIARVLLASSFIGHGIETVLRVIGKLGPDQRVSSGALAFDLILVAAGLLLIVGWKLQWVALALAVFLLVDAFVSHQFWRYAGAEQHNQLLHFLKNMTMLGGFVLLAWSANASTR